MVCARMSNSQALEHGFEQKAPDELRGFQPPLGLRYLGEPITLAELTGHLLDAAPVPNCNEMSGRGLEGCAVQQAEILPRHDQEGLQSDPPAIDGKSGVPCCHRIRRRSADTPFADISRWRPHHRSTSGCGCASGRSHRGSRISHVTVGEERQDPQPLANAGAVQKLLELLILDRRLFEAQAVPVPQNHALLGTRDADRWSSETHSPKNS